MEKRTKQGRGLEEVSQFYLSGGTRDEPRPQEIVTKDPAGGNIVKVFHPGSCLVQSFFLANMALELARNRFSVLVWDCLDNSDENIESLMKTLMTQDNDSDISKVRLYGLPDIVILKESRLNTQKFSDLAGSIHSGNDNRYFLVNMNASLESIKDHDFHADSIFLAHPDEKELLTCYAYIKVLCENGFAGDISIVFDDVEQGQKARSLFDRFAAFVEEKLSLRLGFLGTLCHDKYLQQSIHDEKPLMLLQERSETKEDMISISKNFLQNRQLHLRDQV
jgi:hypothetical protein